MASGEHPSGIGSPFLHYGGRRWSQTMAFFEWTEAYSVGVHLMDEEHKKLVDILNGLYEAVCADKAKDVIEKTLLELLQYTRTHFSNEEKLLKTYGYPQLSEHQEEHQNLTWQVAQLFNDYRGGKPGVPMRMTTFLRDWLAKHIMRTDKAYGSYLNGKGVR
jgi:hemerythrin